MNSNIKLGSGVFKLADVDAEWEPTKVPESLIDGEEKWADDMEYVKNDNVKEATFECDLQINREWTLVCCRNCGQAIPIIQFDALIYGRDGWSCPLCTVIARGRRGEGYGR